MVTVGGKALDLDSFSAQYDVGSIEYRLLQKMFESAFNYTYDNLGQLKFELMLRREIVNAALLLYRSGLRFATFHDAECNPDFWDKTANGGFQLKSGVPPSGAVRDIYEQGSLYATECATAMMIVYYKALLEVYGDTLFNRTFTQIYLMNWNIRQPLLNSVGTLEKAADSLLGDRAYFKNPDVDPKTPWWQGENVIVLPDGKYYGHGIGVQSAEQIIRSLNGNRKRGATTSAYLMDKYGRPDFNTLAAIYYGESAVQAAAARGPISWRPFPEPIASSV